MLKFKHFSQWDKPHAEPNRGKSPLSVVRERAAAFASEIGRQKVVSITFEYSSYDTESGFTVWYWD